MVLSKRVTFHFLLFTFVFLTGLGATGCNIENHRAQIGQQGGSQSLGSQKNRLSGLDMDAELDLLNLSDRKRRFIRALLPHIKAENERIAQVHASLMLMTRKASLASSDYLFLERLARQYRVKRAGQEDQEFVQMLLLKVDRLPVDLVLAQAAMESAWGSSRFATQGNNYFGQWCFSEGCGLVPSQRGEGARHEVRRFATPAGSVNAYMRNINSHPSYHLLRDLRYKNRTNGRVASGGDLAEGLVGYSQMGGEYVVAIRNIIKNNHLHQLVVGI